MDAFDQIVQAFKATHVRCDICNGAGFSVEHLNPYRPDTAQRRLCDACGGFGYCDPDDL